MERPSSYELQIEARRWRSRQIALAFAWIADATVELAANAFRGPFLTGSTGSGGRDALLHKRRCL